MSSRATNAVSSLPQRWKSRWHQGLIYVLLVFIGPVRIGGWLQWVLAFASVAVFVALYFDFFRHLANRSRARVALFGMAALGFALLPLNAGGATYIVFSAAFAAFVFTARSTFVFLAVLAAGVAGAMFLIDHPDKLVIAGWVVVLIFVVGIGSLFLDERLRQTMLIRLAREDIEELAKVAERERIARDLHDVLGHTLSVIALKSELAARLADSDPQRAAREIRDVEEVSRSALAEVRRAVDGYRSGGLAGELRSAAVVLDSAGIRADIDAAPVALSPSQETAVALALREAVTNVIRHARATQCRIEVREDGGRALLRVRDNGVGGASSDGFGLTGMRERVGAAGGTVTVNGSDGMEVIVAVPLARQAEPGAAR